MKYNTITYTKQRIVEVKSELDKNYKFLEVYEDNSSIRKSQYLSTPLKSSLLQNGVRMASGCSLVAAIVDSAFGILLSTLIGAP